MGCMLFLFVLSACSCCFGKCVVPKINFPSQTNSSIALGDDFVNVIHYSEGESQLQFINVHENENTSVVAAKALLSLTGGGSITFLQHGFQRDIVFQLDGVVYSIDPNRMFTLNGLKAHLSPFNAEAAALVLNFSQRVLEIYGFNASKITLALHNNGPGYSAKSYLPGGPFAKNAQKVYIGKSMIARFFFYIVPGVIGNQLFDCLTAADLNAVLQAPTNGTLDDDGSLSVYSALHDKEYVNIEAAAAAGSTGDHVVNQLIMLNALRNVLGSIN